MTDALHRCANCGIADENVIEFAIEQDEVGSYEHRNDHACLQAALAKLRECRPWLQADIDDRYGGELAAELSALLASLPREW